MVGECVVQRLAVGKRNDSSVHGMRSVCEGDFSVVLDPAIVLDHGVLGIPYHFMRCLLGYLRMFEPRGVPVVVGCLHGINRDRQDIAG